MTQSVELVRRARAGDEQALGDLLHRYQDRVTRIARIRMGRRVRAFMDSADIVQNTFLVAARCMEDFEPESHAAIIHWLSRILENQIRDAASYANAAKRDPDRLRRLDVSDAAEGAGGGVAPLARNPRPSELASDAELREIFDGCVRALSPDQREVVLLRDYAGLGWSAVAREMGRTGAEAARQLHRRATVRLARIVSQRMDLEP